VHWLHQLFIDYDHDGWWVLSSTAMSHTPGLEWSHVTKARDIISYSFYDYCKNVKQPHQINIIPEGSVTLRACAVRLCIFGVGVGRYVAATASDGQRLLMIEHTGRPTTKTLPPSIRCWVVSIMKVDNAEWLSAYTQSCSNPFPRDTRFKLWGFVHVLRMWLMSCLSLV